MLPTTVTAGLAKRYRWVDEFGHGWQAQVNNRTNGDGCPVCAGQKVLPGFNDLATTNPVLAAQWHPTHNAPLTPRDVFRSTASGSGGWTRSP